MFKARIVLYSRGKEDLVLTFNTQDTSNTNWFADSNLQTSPWQDIHTTNKNIFSLTGYYSAIEGKTCRNFHINHRYGSCEVDTGWLSIGNLCPCTWETTHGVTSFLYSKKSTPVNWNDYGGYSRFTTNKTGIVRLTNKRSSISRFTEYNTL